MSTPLPSKAEITGALNLLHLSDNVNINTLDDGLKANVNYNDIHNKIKEASSIFNHQYVDKKASDNSYETAKAFANKLVKLNIIKPTEIFKTISQYDRWTASDRVNIDKRVSSCLNGAFDSIDKIKDMIGKANLNVAILDEYINDKNLVQEMITETEKYFQEIEDKNIFDDLNKSLNPIELDLKPKKLSKRTLKEIQKINKLVSDGIKIGELDKYVALGIISGTGLKEWRIQEQSKNNYFYDMLDETSSKEADLLSEHITPKVENKSQFEKEITKAAYRVAGTQISNITTTVLVKALPDNKAEGIKTFLSSEFGKGLVGIVGGMALKYAAEDNDFAQNISKELRITGMTSIGNEAIELLMGSIFDIVNNSINEIPKEEVFIEVEEDLSLLNKEENKTMSIGN